MASGTTSVRTVSKQNQYLLIQLQFCVFLSTVTVLLLMLFLTALFQCKFYNVSLGFMFSSFIFHIIHYFSAYRKLYFSLYSFVRCYFVVIWCCIVGIYVLLFIGFVTADGFLGYFWQLLFIYSQNTFDFTGFRCVAKLDVNISTFSHFEHILDCTVF